MWEQLWDALCANGEVNTAAYAALPHLAEFCLAAPVEARPECIRLIATVEACRRLERRPKVPDELVNEYQAALRQLPDLIVSCLSLDWDTETSQVMAGALLVAKRNYKLGLALLEFEEIQCSSCGASVRAPWSSA